MRSDSQLRTDVVAELNWDASVRDEDIATSVKDGVVTLAGTVETYAQRHAAERAVERVRGVRAIANDLVVKLPGTMERSDADIAHAAVNAFRWQIDVPAEHIQVKVANGWLTLEGEVDRYFQRAAAERAVRTLLGVRGVSNFLKVRAVPTPADLKQSIRAALARQAEADADQINVEIKGSRVTLHGTVRSMAERRDAATAAWNAAGVTTVQNELIISPLIPASL